MLETQQAVVIRSFRYGDNSHIVKAYTAQHGLMSFIVGTGNKSKSKLKPALLQPLSLVEMVYYAKGKGELKRIAEARALVNYQSLPYVPVKSCLALFLAELLWHVLHEEEEDHPRLFPFLQKAFLQLDKEPASVAHFHLLFMAQLSRLLGFAPEHDRGKNEPYFDLQAGGYCQQLPIHPHYLQGEILAAWRQMESIALENSDQLRLPSATRRSLLEAWILYFRLHVHDFGELKSLPVLQEVLH